MSLGVLFERVESKPSWVRKNDVVMWIEVRMASISEGIFKEIFLY